MAKAPTTPLNLSPFQMLVLGVLGAMTLSGLYLSSRGDPIPMPLQLGFLGGIALVLVGAFQSMSNPAADSTPVDLDYFDRKKDRKEQKKKEKALQKSAAEEAALEAKASADAAKAHVAKVKAAKAKAAKQAEKEKEAQKAQQQAANNNDGAVGDGKKKKKKKKKPVKPESAALMAAAAAAAAALEDSEEIPEVEEWSVATDKFAVRKAKKEAVLSSAVEVVDNGAPTASINMNIDKKHYKVIIGLGSKNINALQNMFSCKIQLPNKNSSDDTVTITGNPGHLAAVKEALDQLCEKGYCKALSGDVTDVSMTVSNVGLLIGPGGKHVGTIRDKTGVEINLPPKEERPKVVKGEKRENKDTLITLVGDLAGIQTAMNAINQLMLQGFCDLTHPDWVRIQMGFPGSMLGVLLGPKGSSLREIENKTETTIKVPNAKTDEDKARQIQISIVGAVGNVEKARALIAAIQTDFAKKELDFPSNLLSVLIGNKGDYIKKLQQTHNVRINIEEHVWDPDLKTLSVEGFTKDCSGCIAAINHLVATNARVQVEFPTSRIGFLIGKAGATISKIKDDFCVRINVANHEWDESVRVVSIDGLTDNVASAVAKVEALKIPAPQKPRPPKADKKEDNADDEETPEEEQ